MQNLNANKHRHLLVLCLLGAIAHGTASYAGSLGEDLAEESVKQAMVNAANKAEANRKANEVAAAQREKERKAEKAKKIRKKVPDSNDSNLWYKDAKTGCLIWRGGNDSASATWDGSCDANHKANGQGTVTFTDDGDRYIGEMKDGKANGHGVYASKDGYRYDGQWKDDKRNGRGAIVFSDGNRYEGQWKDDKRNGQGATIFAAGGRYEGEYKNNKKDGYGVAIYSSGGRYEGEWKDDQQNGAGKEFNKDGSLKVAGQWVDGEAPRPIDPVSLVVPDETRNRYPRLVGCIVKSESMNNEERNYWLQVLPVITSDQRKELVRILNEERSKLYAIALKHGGKKRQQPTDCDN